jgi:hypothetical protein
MSRRGGCGFHDGRGTILDILCYKPKLTPKPYDARYDMDTNGVVNILDVLLYKPLWGPVHQPWAC